MKIKVTKSVIYALKLISGEINGRCEGIIISHIVDGNDVTAVTMNFYEDTNNLFSVTFEVR